MLKAFKQFLNEKERIPEKNIPYYVKWVLDCCRYFNVPETQLLTNDQRSQFLTHLAKNHEDWQVQQADRSLRLYGYFLSRAQKNEEGATADLPKDWKKIEERTYDIRTIQELLGHTNLHTTMIYTHVASKNILGVRSPPDK
jgi:hypothetical protein